MILHPDFSSQKQSKRIQFKIFLGPQSNHRDTFSPYSLFKIDAHLIQRCHVFITVHVYTTTFESDTVL